jgi:hypothetical protein
MADIEHSHFRVYVSFMVRLHKTITTLLGILGLIVCGWWGYEIAGTLGILMFVPVGALVGLCLGLLGWRTIYMLALIP